MITTSYPQSIPSEKKIAEILEQRIAILDTSFAMQSGFGDFMTHFTKVFLRQPLRIPSVVKKELIKLSTVRDTLKAELASQALRVVESAIQNQTAVEKGEDCDQYADHVILRVVQQHIFDKHLVALTNDIALMKDLRGLTQASSVSYRGTIEVVKLSPKTNRPKIFLSYQPSMTGKSNNQAESKWQKQAKKIVDSTKAKVSLGQYTPFKLASSPIPTTTSLLSIKHEDPHFAGLKTASGSEIELDQLVAQGGEGAIYTIKNSPLVCKLFFPDKLTVQRRDKIHLMVTRPIQHPHLCWPLEVVLDSEGEFRGCLMRKAEGQPLAKTLFIPAVFQLNNPRWTRSESAQLAIGLLRTIRFLHSLNVIIGDINPSNIMIGDSPNYFSLVDCDSFQVEGYPCPVGTVNFTPAELQNKPYDSFLRSFDHELYSVATLLFMILFPGKAPYSHRGGADGAENIQRGEFPYTTDWSQNSHSAPQGCWMYCWSHLNRDLKRLFAFTFDSKFGLKARPTLNQWSRALNNYRAELDEQGRRFPANSPEVGYDLSILPKNKRYKEGDRLPRDGKTGLERLTYRMYAMRQKATGSERNSTVSHDRGKTNAASIKTATQQFRSPTSRPMAQQRINPPQQNRFNNHSVQETFSVADTHEALEKIYRSRRKQAIIAGLTVSLGCLLGIGAIGWWYLLITILLIPIANHGLNRELSESQYYGIPGSRFNNGDHRCIRCQNRGRAGAGIYISRKSNDSRKVHQCTNCREPLFYS